MTLYGASREFLRLAKRYGVFQAISIQKQAHSSSEYIEFRYQKNKLRIWNETAGIYHLLYSLVKMENLATSIREDPLRRSDIFFDIGANCGIFAYFFKRRFPEVMLYCFEPSKTLNPIIEYNLRNFPKWQIINCAISDKIGEIVFFENTNSMQSSSIFSELVTPFGPKERIIKKTVPSLTIDEFCRTQRIDKLLGMKLDIQGAETQALRHAGQILKTTQNLILEFWLETDIFDLIEQIPLNFRENHQCINDGLFYGDLLLINNK